MKLKKTKLLSLIALLFLLPIITMENNALTYEVVVSQSPEEVFENKKVTITVFVVAVVTGEQIRLAKLSYYLNGVLQSSVDPTSTSNDKIIFQLEPFDFGDVVRYQIYLEFLTATDYQSEYFEFTVKKGLSTSTWTGIIIGSVLAFICLIVGVIWFRKKR